MEAFALDQVNSFDGENIDFNQSIKLLENVTLGFLLSEAQQQHKIMDETEKRRKQEEGLAKIAKLQEELKEYE